MAINGYERKRKERWVLVDGRIINFDTDKGYGFIRPFDGSENLFFHVSQLKDTIIKAEIGLIVEFDVKSGRRGKEAHNVKKRGKKKMVAPEPYEGATHEYTDIEINSFLKEIKKWKLEAKLEDLKRYFFDVPELKLIINGEQSYVIGRKGTGKTALVEYMSEAPSDVSFVEKLSFKNFPFNVLYEQGNDKYTKPNQYITVWKFIIYSFSCAMLAKDSDCPASTMKHINKVFPPTDSDSLSSLVKAWSIGDISLLVKGSGFSLQGFGRKKKKLSLMDKVDNLESFLLNNLTDNGFYLLFDELDEDYKDIQSSFLNSDYLDLLTSLFKAIQDIRAIFGKHQKQLYPVILLRDDIYDLVKDADKNKWRDLTATIAWDENEIRALLKHRLDKVFGVEGVDFDFTWFSIFSPFHVGFSGRTKYLPSFEYITRSTQGRPRDYIQYLKSCAELQLKNGGGKITNSTIKEADKDYSNYLKNELTDEIYGILPDIDAIFRVLGQIRKWIFSRDEFREVHKDQYVSGILTTKDPDFILQTLFYFSVIGNVTRTNHHLYRQHNSSATLNFKEKMVIHRGLMKALQIF